MWISGLAAVFNRCQDWFNTKKIFFNFLNALKTFSLENKQSPKLKTKMDP